MVGVWVGVGVAAVVVVGVLATLSFVPLPGAYNVRVTVQTYAVALVVAEVYGISGVGATVSGNSPILDWSALGISWFQGEAQYKLTACISTHCASITGSSLLPTLPLINGQKVYTTNSLTVGYVGTGCGQPVSVTLYDDGSSIATGSGSVDVGGGC